MPLTIKRVSDGKTFILDSIDPTHKVSEVKKILRISFPPQFEHGCRLQFNGKVLKGKRKLKHYRKYYSNTHGIFYLN